MGWAHPSRLDPAGSGWAALRPNRLGLLFVFFYFNGLDPTRPNHVGWAKAGPAHYSIVIKPSLHTNFACNGWPGGVLEEENK